MLSHCPTAFSTPRPMAFVAAAAKPSSDRADAGGFASNPHLTRCIPWFSSSKKKFNDDFGVTTATGEASGTSVFLRDRNEVFLTYFTTGRGDEGLGGFWAFLDLTPFGRQEDWEDSPEGWPQTPPYQWWRRHDEYQFAKTRK